MLKLLGDRATLQPEPHYRTARAAQCMLRGTARAAQRMLRRTARAAQSMPRRQPELHKRMPSRTVNQ